MPFQYRVCDELGRCVRGTMGQEFIVSGSGSVVEEDARIVKQLRFSQYRQSELSEIARRIRNQMKRRNLSASKLAERCSYVVQDLSDPYVQTNITRERIAKILMNCKRSPAKSAAKVISLRELQVLSRALETSVEWLSGQEISRDLILWDPLADSDRAQQILELLNHYEEETRDVLVWADHLLSSFVTPGFMHAYHEAVFSELNVLKLHKEKARLVALYDFIGNERRKRLSNLRGDSKYCYTQLIFDSHLQNIAAGAEEYKTISRAARRRCLENLIDYLSTKSSIRNLIVVGKQNALEFCPALRDYDVVGVFGRSLALWRFHSGRIAWSEYPMHARALRDALESMKSRAHYQERQAVIQMLKDLYKRYF